MQLRFALCVSFALGLGCWIHWPSLDSGLRSDDFPQRAMLRGEFPVPRSPFDLFDFANGTRGDDVQRLMDFGYLPWWSVPELRLRMWRPLASGLIALEQRVLSADARLQHVHSLAWYLCLVALAALAFRRMLTPSAAAVASLLFAIEEGHTVPVAWLANRSTATASALGLLTLLAYLSTPGAGFSSARAREPPRVSWRAWLTALSATLALLAGEYAFTALAYVVAAAALQPEPISWRIRRALPLLLPAAGYLLLHSLLGSDVAGSGFYLSPLRQPAAYAVAALSRLPTLFADLCLGLPADWFNGSGPLRNHVLTRGWFSPRLWALIPAWPLWHTGIGYLALGLGYALLRLALGRAPEPSRRPLQVLALGSLLALLPGAGSLPGDRLIVGAAFGFSGICAALLVHALPSLNSWRSQKLQSLGWLLVFAVTGPLSAKRVYDQARSFAASAEDMRLWSRRAELPTGATSADTRVYVLATADFTTAANLPWVRLAEGLPLPRSYRRLSPAVSSFDLSRSAERSLELSVLSSNVRYSAQPSLYRAGSAPLRRGQTVQLPGLRVSVLSVRAGNPARMRFDFDRPLDDPRLWFVQSTRDGLTRFWPPKPGETIRLPRPIYRAPARTNRP